VAIRECEIVMMNQQWLLASHPEGMPEASNWSLVERPIEKPGPREILVRAHWLSVDPYMRGRISRRRNYAAGVEVGAVMPGGGVGEVIESRHPDLVPGDIVESFTFGWQEYAMLDAARARKVDPGLGPIHSALSYLGMPGLTAYFAILEVGRARPGDTVVVSAAAGAVGQIAGQLAKLAGCRAVAVAGSAAKLAWCREIGYDALIDHRSVNDLAAAVADACPGGVDLFLDNTAGPIHDAVMQNLAPGARVVVCGQVALADRFDQPDIGPRFLRQIMIARATVQGFLVLDHADRFERARRRLADWARSGRLQHREDILDGIEQMPRAFLRLLTGQNFGKQLVRLAGAPA
jgi:NADPH-dependent curcumin reductase CurA